VRGASFYVVVAAFGLASFVLGARLVTRPPLPPVHPLTGRQIAGLATDARWLERESRAQEEAPDRALMLIGIEPGMIVADVGAGSGYVTTRLAHLVAPTGRVYATDVQDEMLRILQARAAGQHLSNVVIVRGAETETNLPADTLDLALLVDVYHELRHPQEMLRSVRRALKSGGRLVLIEYRSEDPAIPIAPTHRMSVAAMRAEVESEGFIFDRLVSDLPRQHIVMFRR
jgi:predicted methyltransferase